MANADAGSTQTAERRSRDIRADKRPLYIQAEEAIRDLARDLNVSPGDRLPSEAKLAQLLGVSRPVVREALRNLELNREVRRVHGLGTIVSEPQGEITAGLETLDSLESLANRQGWVCGTEDVSVDECLLTPAQAEVFNCLAGDRGVRLMRTKTRGGEPIAVMESVLPADEMSTVGIAADFSGSITDVILSRRHPKLDYARATVSLEVANEEVTRRLGLTEAIALLLLSEMFYDCDGTAFCANRNWFVPGSLRLEIVRRPP
jgi:GntR family transcriptional regulator